MLTRHAHGSLTWIDLESPTQAEIQTIINEYNIAPIVAQELLLPSMKPRAEFHDHYAYFVMHFPALRHTHKTVEQEIDFVIGKILLLLRGMKWWTHCINFLKCSKSILF